MISFNQYLLCEGSSDFKNLQKNKQPLTDQEREKCLRKKATWNNHPNPKCNPVPAVWKSVCPKSGKTTYITNTHRAIATSKSIAGIINKYHNCIKSTA